MVSQYFFPKKLDFFSRISNETGKTLQNDYPSLQYFEFWSQVWLGKQWNMVYSYCGSLAFTSVSKTNNRKTRINSWQNNSCNKKI